MSGHLDCVILQFASQAYFVTSAPALFLYTRDARRLLKRVAGANSRRLLGGSRQHPDRDHGDRLRRPPSRSTAGRAEFRFTDAGSQTDSNPIRKTAWKCLPPRSLLRDGCPDYACQDRAPRRNRVPWSLDPAIRAYVRSFFPISANTRFPRSEGQMKSVKLPVETR